MAAQNSINDEGKFLWKQLLNHLTLIRSNFAFGLQFWALLKDPKTSEGLLIHRIVVKADGIYAIPPGRSMHIPEGESFYTLQLGGPKKKDFEHASMEFVKLHLRVFLVDTKLKAHCPISLFKALISHSLCSEHTHSRRVCRPFFETSLAIKIGIAQSP